MPFYIADTLGTEVIDTAFTRIENNYREKMDLIYLNRVLNPDEIRFWELHLTGKDLEDCKRLRNKPEFKKLVTSAFETAKLEFKLGCDNEAKIMVYRWIKAQIELLSLLNPLKSCENFEMQLMRVCRIEILSKLQKELKLEIEPEVKTIETRPTR